jgi:pyridoxal 5'-phosphate synthase pdxS subunit
MSDPELILQIMDTVSIPVMAKCRIGHFVEAQILEAIGVDYIDESEVLTRLMRRITSTKHDLKSHLSVVVATWEKPCAGLAKARQCPHQGEAGSGDVVEAVRHARAVLAKFAVYKTARRRSDGFF